MEKRFGERKSNPTSVKIATYYRGSPINLMKSENDAFIKK